MDGSTGNGVSLESVFLLNLSDSTNDWNQSVLKTSRVERHNNFVSAHNSLLQDHNTNIAMMNFGNPIQKAYYFLREALYTSRKLDSQSANMGYVHFA